jgi:DnaA family protein
LNAIPQQLSLPVVPEEGASFESFVWSAQPDGLREALQQQAAGSGEAVILLWGGAGTGRSHLLQAVCAAATGAVMYLPMRELHRYEPASVFEGLESLSLLAIDDVDAVCGDASWEEALFHAYNRARAASTALLFSAAQPLAALPLKLADLRSRLAGGLVFGLAALGDQERLELLRQATQRRGLRLDDAVASYLLMRVGRQPATLLQVLDVLDRASLQTQRALTVPFIRETLHW